MASDRVIRPAQGPSKGFIIAGPASGVGTVSYTHLTLPTICSV